MKEITKTETVDEQSVDHFGEGLRQIFLAGMSTLSESVLLEVSQKLEDTKNSIRYEWELNAVSPVVVRGYLIVPGEDPRKLFQLTGLKLEALQAAFAQTSRRPN